MNSLGEAKSHSGFSDAPPLSTPERPIKRSHPEENIDPRVNPHTNLPYSERYYSILEKRKELPAWSARKNFIKLLRRNQVLILVGDTGSGKTTQIPQFIVDAKLNDGLQVAVTQPRRVAAMSVAARVAEEMDVTLGQTVGYTIRFEDCSSKNTVIKYMTDGMLLREAIVDPMLSNYSVIMLDEAHERTIATDVLFGLLKEIAGSRDNLKIVVMSATLDGKKFQNYFGGADLLNIPGRAFPVEIFYTEKPQTNYIEAVISTVVKIHYEQPEGDILVFLTGEDEISKVKDKLQGLFYSSESKLLILPLYGNMEPREQAVVFQPSEERKCILATNIAETSLTIDGIVYVVDTGFSKQNVYNPRARVESLLVAPISKASAQQRAGRAGRTRPGKCFRLYTEEAFNNELIPQTFPEILRSNIATIVLNLKKLGIDDIVHFDFMDPPAPETMMRALEELNYLGALDDEGELTITGELMGEFPVEPQLAKVLVSSPAYKCTRDIVAVVAMLSVPNIFIRPKSKQVGLAKDMTPNAVRARARRGDHITMLNIFNMYQEAKMEGNAKIMELCDDLYLNNKGMQSVVKVFGQLAMLSEKHLKKYCNPMQFNSASNDDILKCLCSGFFLQSAFHMGKTEYLTSKEEQTVHLHPSSVYTPVSMDWVIYHQVVHTSKTYIRTVSEVQFEWLLSFSKEYFDPKNMKNQNMKKTVTWHLKGMK